jgi:hypothetical protein
MKHATQSDESALTGHRFFLLFLLLLGTLILFPYAETSRFGYYAFRVVGSAAILISVYAAKIHRGARACGPHFVATHPASQRQSEYIFNIQHGLELCF